ncbi:polysaccharide deacetylase family protein [Paenibacillus sp. FSL R5-0407]|uniref:polysaccharide deacetylase family protein n=1 Tax=Paenibacillus sp. FSL R5-0407 TaxID=2975320 RepID=UPI0030F70B72
MFKKRTVLALVIALSAVSSPLQAKAAPYPATQMKDRSYYEERGDIVWEVPTEEKYMALTFDDGPDPQQTLKIMEVLKQYEAKATFFLVGDRVERYPEVVRQELQEGHEIANHSFRHPSFQGLPGNVMEDELIKTQDAIYKATGQKPVLFRPPGGYYNEKIIHLSKEHHLQMVLWSWHQDTNDWRSPGVARIANKVLNNARNGDIILMHDFVYNSNQTTEALKIILPELKKRGYSFVTISELLSHKVAPKNHIKVSH